MKTIVVKCTGCIMEEIPLDSRLFDNDTYSMYFEAAIRAVEKWKEKGGIKLGSLIECYDKRHAMELNKHVWCNTYYVLLGARMYPEAKGFRRNFKKLFNVDLHVEKMNDKK